MSQSQRQRTSTNNAKMMGFVSHPSSVSCLQILIFLSLLVCGCDAFQLQGLPQYRQSSSRSPLMLVLQASSRKQNSNNKGNQPRKSRFAQQVHNQSPRPAQANPPQKQPQPPRSSSTGGSSSQQETTAAPRPSQFTSPPRDNNSNNNISYNRKPTTYISPNVPWNSGKSMEELESIMTKRWGTDSSRWSDDDDDKFDLDDEDYEIVYEDDDDSTTKKTTNGKTIRDQTPTTNNNNVNGVDSNNNNNDKGFFFRQAVTNPKESREFYDPEDVGYERRQPMNGQKDNNNNGKTNLNFDNIVAPKPIGGRGTNEKIRPNNNNNNRRSAQPEEENDDDDDDKGGFFFRPPQQQEQQAPRRTTAQTIIEPPRRGNGGGDRQLQDNTEAPFANSPRREQRQTTRAPVLPFMRDEDGTPILLTLEQALKDFDAMVAMSNNDKDDDESESEGAWDTEAKSWEELGITSPILLRNLQRMQCSTPLAVQDKACPAIITGQDVLVGTYTGSGKTLAFLVPLIERILFSTDSDSDESKQQQALQILVVVPGRELASQVVSVARQLLEGTGMKAMLAIGGTGFSRNVQEIRQKKPAIVVGTPGRVAELIVGKPGEKGGKLKVPNLQSLVLDEFDALLEYKPHRDPTAAIVSTLKQRHRDALQSILCSATATDMLNSPKLDKYLRPGFAQAMADRDDILVTSPTPTDEDDESETPSKAITRVSRTVIHGVIHAEHRRLGLETLRRILHTEPIPQQILVFVENSRKVGIVVDKLESMGIIAAPLCGGAKSEKMDRAEVSKALREGYVGIVVATEMAARGLDAPLLTHVINLDLPTDASHYAHRAGRCGRGGRPGVVINLTTSPQERMVPQKFADRLGITMHTVEARAGQLHIVEDPEQQ